jgi:hypothetical protein
MMAQREIFPLETAMQRLAAIASDGHRKELGQLLAHEDADLRWRGTVATDGYVIIATDRRLACAPLNPSHRTFAEIVHEQRHWDVRIEIESLRAWCGDPIWPVEGPCSDCNGAGTLECETCDGHGQCSKCDRICQECDDGIERCDKCDGKGRLARAPIEPRPGRLTDEVSVDRVLLGRALDAFESGPIEISGGERTGSICLHQGGDAVAFVAPYMARHEQFGDSDVPVLPVAPSPYVQLQVIP